MPYQTKISNGMGRYGHGQIIENGELVELLRELLVDLLKKISVQFLWEFAPEMLQRIFDETSREKCRRFPGGTLKLVAGGITNGIPDETIDGIQGGGIRE